MDQNDFDSSDDDDTPLNQLAFRRKTKFKRLRRARGDMPPKKKKTRRRVYVDNALNRRLGRVGKPYGGHHHHTKRAQLSNSLGRADEQERWRESKRAFASLQRSEWLALSRKHGGIPLTPHSDAAYDVLMDYIKSKKHRDVVRGVVRQSIAGKKTKAPRAKTMRLKKGGGLTAYQAFVKANYHTKAVMNAGGPRDRMRKLGAMWRATRGVKDTYRGKVADDAIAPLRGRKRLRRAR